MPLHSLLLVEHLRRRGHSEHGSSVTDQQGWNGGDVPPLGGRMAQFPCEHCGKRYSGAQQTAYPAMVDGTHSLREKRRLCPGCFSALEVWAEGHLFDTANAPSALSWSGLKCAYCGSEAEDQWSVFLTSYARGQERADFWGRVCKDHTEACQNALFGAFRPPQLPLPL